MGESRGELEERVRGLEEENRRLTKDKHTAARDKVRSKHRRSVCSVGGWGSGSGSGSGFEKGVHEQFGIVVAF
jgi:hypothetical protein